MKVKLKKSSLILGVLLHFTVFQIGESLNRFESYDAFSEIIDLDPTIDCKETIDICFSMSESAPK
jgi:hypothetical protein